MLISSFNISYQIDLLLHLYSRDELRLGYVFVSLFVSLFLVFCVWANYVFAYVWSRASSFLRRYRVPLGLVMFCSLVLLVLHCVLFWPPARTSLGVLLPSGLYLCWWMAVPSPPSGSTRFCAEFYSELVHRGNFPHTVFVLGPPRRQPPPVFPIVFFKRWVDGQVRRSFAIFGRRLLAFKSCPAAVGLETYGGGQR